MEQKKTDSSNQRSRLPFYLYSRSLSLEDVADGSPPLPQSATVGVLGGGQLGKMLAMEAVSCYFLSPSVVFSVVFGFHLSLHFTN